MNCVSTRYPRVTMPLKDDIKATISFDYTCTTRTLGVQVPGTRTLSPSKVPISALVAF